MPRVRNIRASDIQVYLGGGQEAVDVNKLVDIINQIIDAHNTNQAKWEAVDNVAGT